MSTTDTTYKLPEGWILTELDSVSLINMGQSPPSYSYNEKGDGLPFFQGKSEFGDMYPKVKKYCNEPIKIVDAEDVLISVRAPIGPTNLAKTRSCIGRGLAGIKGFGGIPNKFILYQLRSSEKKLEKLGTGTTFKAISKNTLVTFPFLLPPLEEQHRIVSRIEELFSELDHAEEGLKKAQKQLEIYKQALLKSAFEGKLTERWREEKKINPLVGEKNYLTLPNSWILSELKDIGLLLSGQHIMKSEYNHMKDGVPYITGPSDFGNKTPRITKWTKNPKVLAEAGDILITVKGSGLGKLNITNVDIVIGRQIMAYRFYMGPFLYLYYFLESINNKIRNLGTGSAIPGISRDNILTIKCPIPQKEEQFEIIQLIETNLTLVENLEKTINKELNKVEIFRQSILKKTFEGTLLPQFKHEKHASELLREIQIEKKNFFLEQKSSKKTKLKMIKPLVTNRSILEILQEAQEPISTIDLWLNSKHQDNIEEFYAELKKVESKIEVIFIGKESLIKSKK